MLLVSTLAVLRSSADVDEPKRFRQSCGDYRNGSPRKWQTPDHLVGGWSGHRRCLSGWRQLAGVNYEESVSPHGEGQDHGSRGYRFELRSGWLTAAYDPRPRIGLIQAQRVDVR